MIDTKGARQAPRAARLLPTPAARPHRGFAVVAHGENVVMVDTTNGRSWALASDEGVPVWQPIAFQAAAPRAPRGALKEGE